MRIQNNYNMKSIISELKKNVNSVTNNAVLHSPLQINNLNAKNIAANFMPVAFKGVAPQITNTYIFNGDDTDLPVTKTKDGYLINPEAQTELIYGVDAVKFLNETKEFPYDTQIVVPRKAEGILHVDNKEIPLSDTSAVIINAGAKAEIEITKGYPTVVISKKDFDWYEPYSKDSKNEIFQNKFKELTFYNSHIFNGEFSTTSFLPRKMKNKNFLKKLEIEKSPTDNNLLADIYAKRDKLSEKYKKSIEFVKKTVEKLEDNGMLIHGKDGYISLKNQYAKDFLIKDMHEKGFTKEEINLTLPVFTLAKDAKMSGKYAIKNPACDYPPELIEKMKNAGILYNNKKDFEKNIYWKKCFSTEKDLREKLTECDFSPEEQNIIVENNKKANLTGFDLSGLRYINENLAVYNLAGKIHNLTNENTNWLTNSTAISSTAEDTPFFGISMVQSDEKRPVKISELRNETLHAHPNEKNKRQTEVYLITSGCAALNIVRNGKTHIKILKEGELGIVKPGVIHCVNTLLGEYEHIVVQIPSAFHYGYIFKTNVVPPEDYNKNVFEEQAKQKLLKIKRKHD